MKEYERVTQKQGEPKIVSKRVYYRLRELEDKIENGMLIELPCKVGDTVYEVFKDHKPPFIQETKIEKIVITAKGLRLRLARNSVYETAVSSIGKTIFFTKAEAEKKLEELSKNPWQSKIDSL